MIPKHLFYYWGNETMSWLRFITLQSFVKLNPDWQVSLYYSNQPVNTKTWKEHNEQDFFTYKGIDYSGRLKDLGVDIIEWRDPSPRLKDIAASHKSNFFKWHMLGTQGGIYADLDILWTTPMDILYDFLNRNLYDTAICYQDWVSIGLLASEGNNRFYMDLYNQALKVYDPEHYQCVGVNSVYTLLYGEGYTRKIFNGEILNHIRSRYPELKVYNLPMGLLYYYNYSHLDKLFIDNLELSHFPEYVMGLHWYAGNPLSQKFNSLLTEDNYKDHGITICNIAQEILG